MKGFVFRSLIVMLVITLFTFAVLSFTPAGSRPAIPATTHTGDLPPAAQAGVSATLGKEDPAYHFQPVAGGWRAVQAQQGLTAEINERGVSIAAGDARLALKLISYGLRPVTAPDLRVSQNRAEYHYPLTPGAGSESEIVEWYLNGPFGLEQGFTLTAPLDFSTPQLTLALALETDLSAALDASGTELALTRADGTLALHYGGLNAFDATGRVLAARMALSADREASLRIDVDTTGARYPITVDPWIQKAKLTASDSAAGDYFGYSVAIDGDTIVVGAECDDSNRGSAYVFVKPSGGWGNMTQTAKLTASDRAANDLFGSAVGISGNTIVVGAIWDNSRQGSVYVFVKPAGGWANMTQTAKLTTSDGEANDWFGDGASINGDIIVAGAEGDDYWRGSVYVFIKPGSGWANMTQTAKLTASDGAGGDRLGVSARISGDTIAAGAVYDDSDRGSAYVFVKPVGGWSNMTQTAKLTPLDSAPSSYYFGGSVDISGGTVVVGANGVSNYTGAAYVFVKPVAGWSNMTQTAKLTASDGGEYYAFGSSVSVSGNLVIVGADGGNSYKGAVYTFVKPTAGWSNMTQTDLLVASDGAEGDGFGLATATNGKDILAGTYAHNSYRGAMYMFSGGTTAVQLIDLQAHSAVAWPLGFVGLGLLGAVGLVFILYKTR